MSNSFGELNKVINGGSPRKSTIKRRTVSEMPIMNVNQNFYLIFFY